MEVKLSNMKFEDGSLMEGLASCNGYKFYFKRNGDYLSEGWNIFVRSFRPEETFCTKEEKAILNFLLENYKKTDITIKKDLEKYNELQAIKKRNRENELLQAIENIKQYPELMEKYLK